MPSGYMKVVMGSKKPKANFLGRYCMLQSWPDYSDPTVSLLVPGAVGDEWEEEHEDDEAEKKKWNQQLHSSLFTWWGYQQFTE